MQRPVWTTTSPAQELSHLSVSGGLGRDTCVGGLQVDHSLTVVIYLQIEVLFGLYNRVLRKCSGEN